MPANAAAPAIRNSPERAVWIAGVIVPILMLALDPMLFRRGWLSDDWTFSDPPLFGSIKPLAYIGIGSAVAAVAGLLLLRCRSAFLAGVIAAASLVATLFGVVLLPLVVMGVWGFGQELFDPDVSAHMAKGVGVALLGLSPLVSGIIVARYASRIYRSAAPDRRALRYCLGAAAFLAVCATAQWQAAAALHSGVADLCTGDAERSRDRARSSAALAPPDRPRGTRARVFERRCRETAGMSCRRVPQAHRSSARRTE